MKKVTLPELGENINKATITYWHFQEGDSVKEGQDLVEAATDKATFNIPSPATGKLSKILVSEGETISVGTDLAEIQD
jgi:2-oxoglutarate dehydrogenase E2 component (dihydrolipoamide succinyltransferase)